MHRPNRLAQRLDHCLRPFRRPASPYPQQLAETEPLVGVYRRVTREIRYGTCPRIGAAFTIAPVEALRLEDATRVPWKDYADRMRLVRREGLAAQR